jgi:hypothetical protein
MNKRGRSHETEILDAALVALKRTAGVQGRVVRRDGHSADRRRGDARIEVRANRERYVFEAEVKAVDRFQTVAQVKTKLSEVECPLLVAPYISPTVAQQCRDLSLAFLDMAGNAYLEAPGLFVFVTGQKQPESTVKLKLHSVSSVGLRVAFALLCQPGLAAAPYRQIALAAGTSLGTITGVMHDLGKRGFVRKRKPRRLLDLPGLLDEWVTHYPIRLRPKLHPRHFDGKPERLLSRDLGAVGGRWSSEVAAARLTGHLKPSVFTIYARKPIREVVAALHLRSQPSGNVEILDQFWTFEGDSHYPDLVPPILAYADLLASRDGRNSETAKLIRERYIDPAFRTLETAE